MHATQDDIIAVIGPAVVSLLTVAAYFRCLSCNVWKIALVQTVTFAIAFTQLLFIKTMPHGWWYTFDIAYTILDGCMAIALLWTCKRSAAEYMSWLYLFYVAVFLYEYSLADAQQYALANQVYYPRMWLSYALDTTLAVLLYLGAVGTPDKRRTQCLIWEKT